MRIINLFLRFRAYVLPVFSDGLLRNDGQELVGIVEQQVFADEGLQVLVGLVPVVSFLCLSRSLPPLSTHLHVALLLDDQIKAHWCQRAVPCCDLVNFPWSLSSITSFFDLGIEVCDIGLAVAPVEGDFDQVLDGVLFRKTRLDLFMTRVPPDELVHNHEHQAVFQLDVAI